MSYESESKLTFGNILLGLLLLGVVVVIGLIVFVYFALTKQSGAKTPLAQPDNKPSQTIEQLSPDGKPLPSVPRARAEATKPNAETPAAAPQANANADKVAKDLASDSPPNMAGRDVAANMGAMGGTEVKPKPKPKPKPPKPKQPPVSNPDAAVANANSGMAGEKPIVPTNKITGERPLEPVNVPPKRTRSENVAGGSERPLQPVQPLRVRPAPPREDTGSRSNSNSGGSERALKPVQKNNTNNNIDNLF